jgi:hypothetical protein
MNVEERARNVRLTMSIAQGFLLSTAEKCGSLRAVL